MPLAAAPAPRFARYYYGRIIGRFRFAKSTPGAAFWGPGVTRENLYGILNEDVNRSRNFHPPVSKKGTGDHLFRVVWIFNT